MTNVAVFDMNETTLDFAPVRAEVSDLLGGADGFTIWFQKILQLAMTSISTNDYQHFGVLAPSALTTVAEAQGVELVEDAWSRVAAAMGRVEPFPDVVEGLTMLREADWTIIALTNSSAPSINGQVDASRLRPLFDHVISVDEVECYKPDAKPYRHALSVAGAEPSSGWMVASHDWDLAGARAVGMNTAFMQRPYMRYAPSYPDADLSVPDFVALAATLTA